jgi:hypothetical protein
MLAFLWACGVKGRSGMRMHTTLQVGAVMLRDAA